MKPSTAVYKRAGVSLTVREAMALYPLLRNISLGATKGEYPDVLSAIAKLANVYKSGLGCGGCGRMFETLEEVIEHMEAEKH